MPLEFALRPRFDLKRPAPRRRLARFKLHPLVLPIGTYWLVAAGLTYGLIHSPSIQVADAAENDAEPWRGSDTLAPASEPPAPTPPPIAAVAPPTVIDPRPAEREPDLEPDTLAGTLRDEPVYRPELDREAPPVRNTRSARKDVSRPAAPPAVEDDAVALAPPLAFEPEPVEEPREPRREVAKVREPEQQREAPSGSLPSCEAASAAANQIIDVGSARGAPDLTRGAFAGVLEHGAYLTPCSIPPRTALEICAAVQNGNVVGVTVTTEPRDPAINTCVRRAVSKLRFPRSPQLDVTRTRFERVR